MVINKKPLSILFISLLLGVQFFSIIAAPGHASARIFASGNFVDRGKITITSFRIDQDEMDELNDDLNNNHLELGDVNNILKQLEGDYIDVDISDTDFEWVKKGDCEPKIRKHDNEFRVEITKAKIEGEGCKEVLDDDPSISLTNAGNFDVWFTWTSPNSMKRVDGIDGNFIQSTVASTPNKYVRDNENNSSQDYVEVHAGNASGTYRRVQKGQDAINEVKILGFEEAKDKPPLVPGADDEKKDDSCEAKGALGWIMCPVILAIDGALNWVDTQIQGLLELDSGAYNKPELYTAWSRIRNISYLILFPIMLVMVIGTALGFEAFSAYTVKKALPRMVAAIIFMALSWYVCVFLIGFFNVVGGGILGLMTQPFGGGVKSLADIAGGGNILTGLIQDAVIIPAAILLLWLFGGTLLLFIGVAFLVLIIRQMFVLALMLAAPLAILAWIFPGNDKLWKDWWSAFSKLLIMYPLILGLIGLGRIFASVAKDTEMLGPLNTLVVMAAYMLPYGLIPLTFKFAGGAFATLSGAVNDRSKGMFDRQRQKRGENWKGFKAGTKAPPGLRGTNIAARGMQRIGSGIGAGVKGRGGFGRRGTAAMSANLRQAGDELMGTDAWKQIQHDDEAMRAATYQTAAEARAAGVSEDAIAKVAGTVGFGKASQMAATKQLLLNKTGYRDARDVAQTIARVSGGNADVAESLRGFNNAYAKQVGRNDLAGVSSSAAQTGQMSEQELVQSMVAGYNSGDLPTIVRNNSGGFRNFTEHWQAEATTAMDDHAAAVAAGDTAGASRAMQRARAAQTAITELQNNKAYATGDNRVLIDNLAANTQDLTQFLRERPDGGQTTRETQVVTPQADGTFVVRRGTESVPSTHLDQAQRAAGGSVNPNDPGLNTPPAAGDDDT